MRRSIVEQRNKAWANTRTRLVKLSEFDPKKHAFEKYTTMYGTELQEPVLMEDIRTTGRSSGIEKLQTVLGRDPKARAYFMILTGSKGGAGSAWYSLKNMYVRVWLK